MTITSPGYITNRLQFYKDWWDKNKQGLSSKEADTIITSLGNNDSSSFNEALSTLDGHSISTPHLQTILFIAALEEKASATMLKSLLQNDHFKAVAGKEVFKILVQHLAETTKDCTFPDRPFGNEKLTVVLEHLGSQPNVNLKDSELGSKFHLVTDATRTAIKTGVSPTVIDKFFNNPTISSSGIKPNALHWLANIAKNVIQETSLGCKVEIQDKYSLLSVIENQFKKLFPGETLNFARYYKSINLTVVDESSLSGLYSQSSQTNFSTSVNATGTASTTNNTANATMPETESSFQEDAQGTAKFLIERFKNDEKNTYRYEGLYNNIKERTDHKAIEETFDIFKEEINSHNTISKSDKDFFDSLLVAAFFSAIGEFQQETNFQEFDPNMLPCVVSKTKKGSLVRWDIELNKEKILTKINSEGEDSICLRATDPKVAADESLELDNDQIAVDNAAFIAEFHYDLIQPLSIDNNARDIIAI